MSHYDIAIKTMTIDGTIYVSGAARDEIDDPGLVANGVQTYAEDALDHISVNHNITTSSEKPAFTVNCTPPPVPYNSQMECILNQFSDWVDNQSNDRSTDFNLLILPNYYLGPIGLGYIGGDTCIVRGAEMIEDELDTNYPRYQTSNDRTKAAIHEIGHNLSLTHSSNNGGDNGAPPDGRTMLYYWSQLFKIYAVSPHGPPLHEMPVDNECGETQQLAGGSHGETNDFYFYDGCAGNFIQQYNN